MNDGLDGTRRTALVTGSTAGADDVWRARVGDYRILYRIEQSRLLVLVIRIAHRREVDR